MNCLLGDAGIAVGLTSLPFRKERAFYNNEIANSLFPKYKQAVLENFALQPGSPSYSEFQDYFYEPVPYYLFGSFDLAVVALVDDFEMTARTFRPFDPMLMPGEKDYPENFFYKVITGPTPQFRPDDSIVRIAASTFLRDDRLPLFAMSLLKLNNSLLLGTGTDFLRLVVRFIHSKAKLQKIQHKNLQWILLESHSAHEITLLIFTDSYSAATKLIAGVREARVRDLVQAESATLDPKESLSLLKNCLLTDLAVREASTVDLAGATLFADSESYFGFDFRLLDQEHHPRIAKIDEQDSLDLICQWSVRPGDLLTSLNELAQRGNEKVNVGIGRGDLFVQSHELSTRIVIKQVIDSLGPNSLPRRARRRQTIPAVPYTIMQDAPVEPGPSANDFETHLSLMRFTVDDITVIQDRLRSVGTPKILTGKVLNAFTNFNDGILDPSLYGYFIELLPLMESIQQTVDYWSRDSHQSDLGHICGTLEKVTDNFERAYRNRFYNSYRMGDVTDFNLDFKGGIQQLLTSFDAAYKAICLVLGQPQSFVYVAGSPGVYSTAYEVRLNYYHVFQPEIFGCISNHEAANSYLSRFTWDTAPNFARAAGLITSGDGSDSNEHQHSVLQRLVEMRESANLDQQCLLDHVTPRLFNYVFVDLLAFYFGYNRNMRLFSHWYWGYFSQNSAAKENTGAVDEIQFVGFMLRMLWIARVSGMPECNLLIFGDAKFDSLSGSWRPILSRFLDWLWADDEIRHWNAEVIEHVETRFREINGLSEHRETMSEICNRLDDRASQLSEKLGRGEVCLYTRGDDKSMFRFTEQLFYAYLRLVADRFGAGGILLTRSKEGSPNLTDTNAKAVFDPIGGIFTHDPITRRERFRYRAGLTMSLWDMAQKEKKELVLNRLTMPAVSK